MITTRIQVKPHICEYIRGKYAGVDEKSPVQFPAHSDIYFTIWDFLVTRPAGCGRDCGNLEIVLPARHGSKPPAYYNYLGDRAQKIIGRRLEMMMWAEYRMHVEAARAQGVQFMTAIEQFMTRYRIRSISEDAFQKNYYRYRLKCYGLQKQTI
jgi:hypothetical protein